MLKIDFRNSLEESLGLGLSDAVLQEMEIKYKSVMEKFQTEDIGFKKLPNSFESLKTDLEKAQKQFSEFASMVVIGIGGSDLGTKSIVSALKSSVLGKQIKFAGDTTDPDAISGLISSIDLSSTLFIVVSKSGDTIEMSSLFVYLRDLILREFGKESLSRHFLFITDPIQGTLKALSRREGYQTIDIPTDVGGRFSVLSSVGMVPSFLVGLKVEDFLKGAKELDLGLAYRYALIVSWYYRNGVDINVFMPYKYNLRYLSLWYQQLVAESLGKKFNSRQEQVFEGITPISALGPVDQHSLLQLLNEGPNNKLVTFLRVEKSESQLNLPTDYQDIEEYEFLEGKSFSELLALEQETTAYSLTQNKRANITIELASLDEYHLGQIMYFFEVVVTLVGFLLDINPFDQPGVELSKNTLYGVLGKEGYDQYKRDFDIYKL